MSATIVVSGSHKKSASKTSKTAVAMSHPKYSEMIVEAVAQLKERGGSSRAAILKYILAKYPVKQDPTSVNGHIRRALQSMTTAGTLKHAKATSTGAAGRFKLGDKNTAKKTKTSSPTKSVTKKSSTKPKSPKKAKTAKKSLIKTKTSPKKAVASAVAKKVPKVASAPKTAAAAKASPKKASKPRGSPKKVVKSPKKSPKKVIKKSTK